MNYAVCAILIAGLAAGCASPASPVPVTILKAEEGGAPSSPQPVTPPAPPVQAAAPPSPALIIDRLPDDFPHGGRGRMAGEIDLIVIHTIGGAECHGDQIVFTNAQGSAVFWRDWFAEQDDKSIHYIISRDGAVAQQRPDLRTGGHVSFHGVIDRVNDRSIGIELVNRGDGLEPFPPEQIDAVKALVKTLSAHYALAPERLVTHAALDPRMQPECGGKPLRRNVDPGPLFPLDDVRAEMAPLN